MKPSTRPFKPLALAATACAVTVTLAVVSPAAQAAVLNCDSASYPSSDWSACETANLAVNQGSEALLTAMSPQTAAATSAYQAQRALIPLTDPERQPNPSPAR
jgi:hypothetical protein